jgi:hypothetical protein
LTAEETVKPIGRLSGLGEICVSHREAQGDATRNKLTLSDCRKRRGCIRECDLVVYCVVPLTRCVSLHGSATVKQGACHPCIDRNHMKARAALGAASDESIHDGTWMHGGWEARCSQDNLEFIANPHNSGVACDRARGADDGVDEEFSDIITISDRCVEP